MKRVFDIALASVAIVMCAVPLAALALAVKCTSRGPALYWSDRVGRGNKIFSMPKFRTMRVGTPEVASHLLADPTVWLTPIGGFLRRTSLDELPQLWCILRGDMSFVGPRPALYNQHDLVALRVEKGVDTLVPGVTGWAQINGRDESPVPVKVAHDEYYLGHRSFLLDLEILARTFWKVLRREGTAVPAEVAGADSPAAMARVLHESGDAWFVKGEFARAIADYDQAIRLSPSAALDEARTRATAAMAAQVRVHVQSKKQSRSDV